LRYLIEYRKLFEIKETC